MPTKYYERRESGLASLGDLTWGTHFGLFYRNEAELLQALVPYFAAGLANNELCLWVISPQFDAEEARKALREALPNFEQDASRGQIEILSLYQRKKKRGGFERTIVAKLDEAIVKGFDGLRLASEAVPYRADTGQSGTFTGEIASLIRARNVIAVFTYYRESLDAAQLLDIVKDHGFALMREDESWKVIESAEACIAKDVLKRSEEKRRDIFSKMTEGFALHRIVLDRKGKACDYVFLEVNEAFERLTGLRAEDIIGSRVTEVLPGIERDKTDWIGRYGKVALTGEPTRFESYSEPLNRWYSVSAFSPQKGFLGVLFSDITERRRAEEKSQRQNAVLRGITRIFEKATGSGTEQKLGETCLAVAEEITGSQFGCLGEIGPDGLLHDLAISDAGWEACALLDKTGHRKPPGNFPIHGLYGAVLRNTDGLFTNQPAAHPDSSGTPKGHPKLTSFLGAPLIRDGAVIGMIALANRAGGYRQEDLEMLRALTPAIVESFQRLRAEKAVRESEQRSKRAQEIAHLGSWELDLERNLLTWSDEVYRIFGLQPGEFRATYEQFLECVHPDDRAAVDAAYTDSLAANRDGYEIEHRIVRKDTNDILVVHEKCEHFRDASGAIVRSVGMVHDITERKRMEEALRLSRDNLEARVRERTAALERINEELRMEMARREKAERELRQAQKLEMIGSLAGSIAHDLNNILLPIVVNAELVLEGLNEASAIRKNLDRILRSALRGKELVKRMLLFGRKSERKDETFPLGLLIEETFELLRSVIPSTIEIKIERATSADIVRGDSAQIQQVIMNLCTNAAYAMRGRTGSIDICLRDVRLTETNLPAADMRPGDYLALSVKDTGCGMDEAVKKRIFEPFFTSKPAGEGTGLGLAVVYGIVKSHGGNIDFYSEPGKGSVFTVYIPRIEGEVSTKQEKNNNNAVSGGSERVLIVDDEEEIAVSVQNMLQRSGYQVTALTDSREALRIFSEEPSRFDLVITDQTMPFLTGESLGKALMRIRPDVAVILCTGYSDSIFLERAMALGFQGFIMKPFSLKEGLETVRRVLDRKQIGDE